MNLRFWRKNNPDLTQSYFETEDVQDRGAHSWLLAIITFLVTIAVLFLLFFGGRWIYHRFKKTDVKKTTSAQPADSEGGVVVPKSTVDQNSTDKANTSAAASPSPTKTTATSGDATKPGTLLLPNSKANVSLPITGMDGPEELR